MQRRRQYPQADPPDFETCAVYVFVFLFLLGIAVWIVLKTSGVLP